MYKISNITYTQKLNKKAVNSKLEESQLRLYSLIKRIEEASLTRNYLKQTLPKRNHKAVYEGVGEGKRVSVWKSVHNRKKWKEMWRSPGDISSSADALHP